MPLSRVGVSVRIELQFSWLRSSTSPGDNVVIESSRSGYGSVSACAKLVPFAPQIRAMLKARMWFLI